MRCLLFVALFVATSPASAEQTPTELVLGKIMSAYVLEQSCPSMRIDVIAVGKRLADLGLTPADIAQGGRYHPMMVDQAARMRANDQLLRAAGKSPTELTALNCRNASEFYGPTGWSLRGLMIPRN